MLRVRRSQFDSGYVIDNGKRSILLTEKDVDLNGFRLPENWLESQKEPIDIIQHVEVGGVYDLDEIPEKNETVIMSMNAAASGWLVLTYNFGQWNFGTEPYHAASIKCKWKVLSL